MTEPTDHGAADEAVEQRLRTHLVAELERATRDYQPPILRGRRPRSGSWVPAVIIAAIILPVAIVAVFALGENRSIAPAASTRPVVSPSSSGRPSPTAGEPTGTAPSTTEGNWPGRVVATFVSVADTLTYDPGRGVVWIPVTQTDGPDYLYRYDPRTGTTARWDLPETTYRGIYAQVIVDGSGAVWVNDDGYRLVRFDPATTTMTSLVLPLEVPGTNWADGGTWVSAIAADGDGVLVARNQVPFLVRLGPSVTVTRTIDLPTGFEGATGLAVAGGHIFMTSRAGGLVTRFSLDGQLEARFSASAQRLVPHGDGVIAMLGWAGGARYDEILAYDGTVTGTVAPPFTLPPIKTTVTNPLGKEVPVTIAVTPSALVGDEDRTSWYLVRNEPVLREFVAGP